MLLELSYMGSKRRLLPYLVDAVDTAPSGPLLDLFSGVCCLPAAIAPRRPVWCNDLQLFASSVAAAFFTSAEDPASVEMVAQTSRRALTRNLQVLEDRCRTELILESQSLESADLGALSQLETNYPTIQNDAVLGRERRRLSRKATTFPYRLFTITFAGGFCGLRQSMEIDSIRYAADSLLAKGRVSAEQHRWLCLALCQAVGKVATTTGHFAQFLRPNPRNARRFLAQRRRSVWAEWLGALTNARPLGSRRWRSGNKAFHADAQEVVQAVKEQRHRPAVIYADPPYSKDQYSRYYHVYETVLRYDYPKASGKGRYRPDRPCSTFSLRSRVREAFDRLIAGCAGMGSRIILSYPARALLDPAEETILQMLRRHYGNGKVLYRIAHSHSSLGASKGAQSKLVHELIFQAG